MTPHAFRSPASSSSTLYDPPIPEFSVVQVRVPAGKTEVHPPLGGPSIIIITEGKGYLKWTEDKARVDKEISEVGLGDVLFVGAATEVEVVSSEGNNLVLYRAFVETEQI